MEAIYNYLSILGLIVLLFLVGCLILIIMKIIEIIKMKISPYIPMLNRFLGTTIIGKIIIPFLGVLLFALCTYLIFSSIEKNTFLELLYHVNSFESIFNSTIWFGAAYYFRKRQPKIKVTLIVIGTTTIIPCILKMIFI